MGQLLRASRGVGGRFAAGAAGSSDSAEMEGAGNQIFWVSAFWSTFREIARVHR
jgi:hypothetical protein